jgi:hypothetical protein
MPTKLRPNSLAATREFSVSRKLPAAASRDEAGSVVASFCHQSTPTKVLDLTGCGSPLPVPLARSAGGTVCLLQHPEKSFGLSWMCRSQPVVWDFAPPSDGKSAFRRAQPWERVLHRPVDAGRRLYRRQHADGQDAISKSRPSHWSRRVVIGDVSLSDMHDLALGKMTDPRSSPGRQQGVSTIHQDEAHFPAEPGRGDDGVHANCCAASRRREDHPIRLIDAAVGPARVMIVRHVDDLLARTDVTLVPPVLLTSGADDDRRHSASEPFEHFPHGLEGAEGNDRDRCCPCVCNWAALKV